jgi:hypothetical protein
VEEPASNGLRLLAPGFWLSVYNHFPVAVCFLTAAFVVKPHYRREKRGGGTFDKQEERGLVKW